MAGEYNLQRFVDAQRPVYDAVRAELCAGRKRSHWMWFIFPQIRGLGHSMMAQQYAISSLDEAKAYLAHPVLGERLRECSRILAALEDRPVEGIFSYPDDMKFHSSMTLFAQVSSGEVFDECLKKYFKGHRDAATLDRI